MDKSPDKFCFLFDKDKNPFYYLLLDAAIHILDVVPSLNPHCPPKNSHS